MYLRKRIITTLIVTVTLMLVIGFSYAKFIVNDVEGNNNYNTIISGTSENNNSDPTFTITYLEGDQLIDSTDMDPDYQKLVKFSVSTTANVSQKIMIKLDTIINTATSGTYTLYSCEEMDYPNITLNNAAVNCTSIGTGTLFKPGILNKIHMDNYLTLNADSTNYYALIINTTSASLRYKGYLTVKSYYDNSLENLIYAENTPVSDAVASTYVTAATGINFGAISSPTNGQGLYINDKVNIAGDKTTGKIKYFRGGTYCAYTYYTSFSSGNCTNAGGTWASNHCSLHDNLNECNAQGFTYYELKNNVLFAGFAWKIIRINEDGSIRLLYNGTSTLATDISVSFTNNYFYSSLTAASGINYQNSNIRSNLTTWYNDNLASYGEYLIDKTFCNDLSSGSYSSSGSYDYDYYRVYDRAAGTITYDCPISYTFSMARSNLEKPIGIISSDEAVYAGLTRSASNYLAYVGRYGYAFWTMSPAYRAFDEDRSYYYMISIQDSKLYANAPSSAGSTRPVINLKSDVLATGTGTLGDPFVVQTN